MRKLFKTLRALMISAAVALSVSSAFANTAANTAIVNTATLNYAGGTATASVTVTVNLVPSTPNVTITNATGAYTAPDTPTLTDSVTIRSTANGPADYTVAPSVTASANTTGPTVTGGTTVSIGATVTTGTSGTTYVNVPASGASGNNATVNGVGVGDRITFTAGVNTITKDVVSTTDNGDGTFRISWDSASPIAAGDVPPAGTQVGEIKSVSLTVKPGTITTLGTDLTVTVKADVSTSGAADASATTSPANKWTSALPTITMTKYVRNFTTGAAGTAGATSFTINSATSTYYTAGVTGKPGDVLEYVIQAADATGSADLTGCSISDGIPTAYVDFNMGSYGGANQDVYYIDTAGAGYKLQAAGTAGTSQATYATPNLSVNVGNGANSTTTGAIPGGKNVVIAYRVTIK